MSNDLDPVKQGILNNEPAETGRERDRLEIVERPGRKIRVLLIITRLAIGGATNVVLNIADFLNDHPDFEVQLLTGPVPAGRTDMTYWAVDRGIDVRVVPSLINHISPLDNLKATADIRRIIAQGNYDIVHTHSSVAGVVGRLAAFTAGAPVIVHHVHGWGLHEGMSGLTRMLYLNLERLCARFTDSLIVVSKPDIKKGLAHRIGREGKFVLIYNGIALEDFQQQVDDQQLRSELGLDPVCKLVGMIGRLDEQKNPLDLIRAAAIVIKSYPEVQFLIAGDGPLRPECEQLIKSLDLENGLFLLGYRKDVARILASLTLTAMSSLWEGLPIAFLEAMAAGKPIVANDVDGASDVVIGGETGFLVPPHQPSKMAEQILTLLNNEALCNEMGRTAQERSSRFSIQGMVGSLESLYKDLYFADQYRKSGLVRSQGSDMRE